MINIFFKTSKLSVKISKHAFDILIIATAFATLSLCSTAAYGAKTLITINQFVSHPALDQARYGVEEALKNRGLYPDKVTIKFDNAQGNIATSVQIAKHQASLQPSFMVAIATPAAQNSLKAAENNTIIAFVAVSDFKSAGLVGPNVIGVVDTAPLAELLDISLVLLPKMKNIGVVYNAGEINSVKIIEGLEEFARLRNLNVEKAQITTSTNIKSAAQKLIGKVDAIYLPLDNTVVSALNSLVQIARAARIPIIANDPSLVDSGLLFALGSDYFKSGEQLGNMIADKIEGKGLKENIQQPNVKELKINKSVAEKLNITIPLELEKQGK